MIQTKLLFLILTSLLPAKAPNTCPRPWCKTCLPIEVHDAPGVGFDLSTSYGTAAVHYHNGTTVDIAKIQANPEYTALIIELERLSHTQPTTYDTVREGFLDWLEIPKLRRWQRWINKKLGHPASTKVSILSTLLADLKQATENKFGQSTEPLKKIVITTPDIPALTQEDLTDALEYLGLEYWMSEAESEYYPDRIIEADAVYAANRFGLCEMYKDFFFCMEEFEDTPDAEVVFVSFTRHHLYTSIIRLIGGEAFSRFVRDEEQFFDFGAGLNTLEDADNTSNSLIFWNHIRAQIFVHPTSLKQPVTHILLAGECALDTRFRAVLADALAELDTSAEFRFDVDMVADPTFAAARGAALYARRRQEVQGDCSELPKCEIQRREERKGRGRSGRGESEL